MALNLFAYGTLMLPEIMRAVTGQTFAGQAARLPDYASLLLHRRSYPGLIPQSSAVAEGVLYSDLDREAWRLLDAFEDDCYRRERVIVLDANDQRHTAAVYVMKAEFYDQLSDKPWSADEFRQYGLEEFLLRYGLNG